MSIKNTIKKAGVTTLASVSAVALFSPAALADSKVRVHYPNHASKVISVQSVKTIHSHKSAKADKSIRKFFKQFRKAGYSKNQSIAMISTIYRENAKFGPSTHHHTPIYFGLIPSEYSSMIHYAKAHHVSVKNPTVQFHYLLVTRGQRKAFAKRSNENPVQLDRYIAHKILRVILLPNKSYTRKLVKHIQSVIFTKRTVQHHNRKGLIRKTHSTQQKAYNHSGVKVY